MLGFVIALLMNLSVSALTIYIDTLAYKIVEWKVPDGTVVAVEVVQNTCDYKGHITVPAQITYQGQTYDVVGIGANAFNGCKDLESLELPDGIHYIKDRAFTNCTNLKTINIPNSISSIGKEVFNGCDSLPVINGLRYADTYLIGVTDTTNSYTTYTIKDDTRWIGYRAFALCKDMESISLPNTVRYISKEAFYFTKLKAIALPDSLSYIGADAFSACDSIKEITIPKYLDSIDRTPFDLCKSLKKVNYTAINCTLIDFYGSFNFNYAEEITIGEEVKVIPPYLCASSKIKEIICPNSVEILKTGALLRCNSLRKITLPSNLKEIEEVVFSYDKNIDTIICLSEIPPYTYEFTFNPPGEYVFPFGAVTLIVPCGAGDNYKNAPGKWSWSKCNIVEDCENEDSDIEEITENNSVSIYPNPANYKVTIHADGDVTIINFLGQSVKVIKNIKGVKEINVEDLESGIYYVKANNATMKLIVE